MVRHSTFQVYSDVNTKTEGGYHDPTPAKTATSSATTSDNNVKGVSRVVTDKVENVMGSCAGAGSSEFHLYLNARKREAERLDSIDIDDKKRQEERLRQQKIERNKFENEERERKNADKRKKKKDKILKKRKLSKIKAEGSAKSSDDSDNDEDNSSPVVESSATQEEGQPKV